MPQAIQLNIPFILILGILAIAIALSYWQYRSTIPNITNMQRSILFILRFLTIFLLIFILFKPVLDLRYQKRYVPTTQIYLDKSLSIAVTDSTLDPEYQMAALMKSFSSLANCSFYAFNDDVNKINTENGFSFSGPTNFKKVFNHLNKSKTEQALIISDGFVTEGGYPQLLEADKEIKLYTLGTGLEQTQQDFFISHVDFEPLTYLNETQNIRIKIGSRRLKEKSAVDVQFRVQGKVISRKKMMLDSSNAFQNVDFEFTPRKLGLTKIQVNLKSSLSDYNELNNSRNFLTTVLKKKLTIAIYSARADYDGKFIYQILKSEPDFNCHYYIERSDGSFGTNVYPDKNNDPDIFILQNYPGAGTPSRNLKYIENLISNRKSSLLLLIGNSTRLDKLNSLIPFLPFKNLSLGNIQIEKAGYSINSNPLMDLFGISQMNQNFWQNIPPIFQFKQELPLKSNVTTLVHSAKKPIIVQYEKTAYRNITFIGQGFWRWHFLLQEKPNLNFGYRNLLINCIRWLGDKQEMKQVQLSSGSSRAYVGQPIKLEGFLYDAAFKPIADGQINIKVKTTLGMEHILAQQDSNGLYISEYRPISEGRVRFIAEGTRDQLSIGFDSIEVEVLPLEKEFLYSGINESYLSDIAENHGGRYFHMTQIDSLIKALEPSSQTRIVESQIDLWNHFYLFLIILILILAEWVLRKRFGLI